MIRRSIFLLGVFVRSVRRTWSLVFDKELAFVPTYEEASAIIGGVRKCAEALNCNVEDVPSKVLALTLELERVKLELAKHRLKNPKGGAS